MKKWSKIVSITLLLLSFGSALLFLSSCGSKASDTTPTPVAKPPVAVVDTIPQLLEVLTTTELSSWITSKIARIQIGDKIVVAPISYIGSTKTIEYVANFLEGKLPAGAKFTADDMINNFLDPLEVNWLRGIVGNYNKKSTNFIIKWLNNRNIPWYQGRSISKNDLDIVFFREEFTIQKLRSLITESDFNEMFIKRTIDGKDYYCVVDKELPTLQSILSFDLIVDGKSYDIIANLMVDLSRWTTQFGMTR